MTTAWLVAGSTLMALGIICLVNAKGRRGDLMLLGAISVTVYIFVELLSPSDLSGIDSVYSISKVNLEGILIYFSLGLIVGWILARAGKMEKIDLKLGIIVLAVSGLLLFVITEFSTSIVYSLVLGALWALMLTEKKWVVVGLGFVGLAVGLVIEWFVYDTLMVQQLPVGIMMITVIIFSLLWRVER